MKYSRDYFVHYYDSRNNKKATITAILRYFEDIAMLQSEQCGIGLEYYDKFKVAWLLYKWDIKINSYPDFMDNIKVNTTPMGYKGYLAYRHFEILGREGVRHVNANSLWFYFDTQARKPLRIAPEMIRSYEIQQEDKKMLKMEDPEIVKEYDSSKDYYVRYSDIDTNNHVNNIRYVQWALEMIPADVITSREIRRLKVIYKKETSYGTTITSSIKKKDSGDKLVYLHKISEGENGLCFLETEWE
jgi:medium-chain acyl-[acyl-carrier-protein] hydrolase